MNLVLVNLIKAMVKRTVKEKSLRAVRLYVRSVESVRSISIGVFWLGFGSAILVAGVLLTVFGLVGLLPTSITEEVPWPIVSLSVGVLMAVGSGMALGIFFNQQRWLEASRSYELMETVMEPWPGMIPPNPFKVMVERAEEDSGESRERDSRETVGAAQSHSLSSPLGASERES